MISINWATRVITVPKAFLTPIGGSVYTLDTDAFRLALKDIEDSVEGMAFPVTHRHNTAATLGGVTYARLIEIINGYTVTFEDDFSHYAVSLIGSNNNIADVANVNHVSIRTNNAAGLIEVATGGGGTDPTVALVLKLLRNKQVTDPATGTLTVFDDDGVTPLVSGDLFEDAAGSQRYRGQGAERRERLG